MRYITITDVPPEEALERARTWFAEHSRMRVAEASPDSVTFTGEIGRATLRVDREGGHTNIHVETDRGVGFDVTDLAKRFLYTLGHV